MRDSTPQDVSEDRDIDRDVSVIPNKHPAKPFRLKYLESMAKAKRFENLVFSVQLRFASSFTGLTDSNGGAKRARPKGQSAAAATRTEIVIPMEASWKPTPRRIVTLSNPHNYGKIDIIRLSLGTGTTSVGKAIKQCDQERKPPEV